MVAVQTKLDMTFSGCLGMPNLEVGLSRRTGSRGSGPTRRIIEPRTLVVSAPRHHIHLWRVESTRRVIEPRAHVIYGPCRHALLLWRVEPTGRNVGPSAH